MSMWILIIMLFGNGAAIDHVEGFPTAQSCERAAVQIRRRGVATTECIEMPLIEEK